MDGKECGKDEDDSHNKFGLHDSKAPPYSTLSETFTADSYVQGMLSKINERIQEKEANKKYSDFKNRFNKSVLAIYLDDLYVEHCHLEIIISHFMSTDSIRLFDLVYLCIRSTYHTSPSGIKHIGGFYLIGQARKT